MRLYFSPGACSLAPHIVAREAGLPFELERVDLRTKKTASGKDYLRINPKGYVPALEIDGDDVLTEVPAILLYLADQKPDARLAPLAGTLARYRLIEMLAYIGTEIHKSYSPLFNDKTPAAFREDRLALLRRRYALLDEKLGMRPYLVGETPSVADAYLFTVTQWAKKFALDLTPFPNIVAFEQRMGARPAVIGALAAEAEAKAA
ncbi:MAG: glutathione transferase GstA [Labilithrix sp.]|nr:glutathione transferase GstA [Labilithrix sp.]